MMLDPRLVMVASEMLTQQEESTARSPFDWIEALRVRAHSFDGATPLDDLRADTIRLAAAALCVLEAIESIEECLGATIGRAG